MHLRLLQGALHSPKWLAIRWGSGPNVLYPMMRGESTPEEWAYLYRFAQAETQPIPPAPIERGLRVPLKGGGCGGMQYGMTFDTPREDDEVYEQNGMRVIVDPTSLGYIEGANIDYVDNLMGGGFHIDNPQAVSSCGCGSSFRTAGQAQGEQGGSCGHH